MSKLKLKKGIFIVIILLINIGVLLLPNAKLPENYEVSFNLTSTAQGNYQLLYDVGEGFGGDNYQELIYDTLGKNQKLSYNIPKQAKKIRIDFGDVPSEIVIENLTIKYRNKLIDLTYKIQQEGNESHHLENFELIPGGLKIRAIDKDPYLVLDIADVDLNKIDYIFIIGQKVMLLAIINLLILGMNKAVSGFNILAREIYNSKELMWKLAKNDFKTKYAGSYLGIFWAFVQPVVTVMIYWFVFQVGFKSAPVANFPFVLWLIAGMVPWFFFSEALLNATNSMMEYSYLVKKVVFKISVLPMVKVISSLFVHIFFIIFTFGIYGVYGYAPTPYSIQIVYYSLCTFILVLGLSYATCAIVIFFKDLGQIINIGLQIGMWMTPIMWSYTMITPQYQWILKINPMYYIVQGYRDSFIDHVWFWQRYNDTLYFWIITLGCFVAGTIIFKRLKVHFSDVL